MARVAVREDTNQRTGMIEIGTPRRQNALLRFEFGYSVEALPNSTADVDGLVPNDMPGQMKLIPNQRYLG